MLNRLGLEAITKWLALQEKQIAIDFDDGGPMAKLRLAFFQLFGRWPKED